jgi:PAP2 superfamily protein
MLTRPALERTVTSQEIHRSSRPLNATPLSGSTPQPFIALMRDTQSDPSISVEPLLAETVSSDHIFESDNTDDGTPSEISLPEEGEPISFREDLRQLLPMLRDDAYSVVTWRNAIILGTATGAALAIRADLDDEVRADTAKHTDRWGAASPVLRQFGEPSVQMPFLFTFYGYSVWQQDDELHQFSKALISAHAISSLTTVAIKGVTNTDRPTDQFLGGHYGFPSYHTSSTFAIAATIEEYYGWQAGLPAYGLAGLVGWSRIDQREHDLSDVMFGAALGYVVGKAVAAAHRDRDSAFQVSPYFESTSRSTGLKLELQF